MTSVSPLIRPEVFQLFAAAQTDDLELLDSALSQGADPFLQVTKFNRNTMHIAAIFGSKNVAQRLIEVDKEIIWARDGGGRLPIDHARARRNLEIFELLYAAMYPPGWFLHSDQD